MKNGKLRAGGLRVNATRGTQALTLMLALSLLGGGAISMTAWAGEILPEPVPTGGTPALVEQSVLRNKTGVSAEKIESTLSGSEQLPFTQFTRVTVAETSGKPWASALDIPLNTKILAGDLLFLRFYYRANPESGADPAALGKFTVQVSEWKEPYGKMLDRNLEATPVWQRCDIAITADRDYEADRTELTFLFGEQPQSIDIGGVQLLAYYKIVEKDELPPDGQFAAE